MQKTNRSKVSYQNTGAKVPSQPSFRLVMVEAGIRVTTNDQQKTEREMVWEIIKSIPLMKGMNRETAKRSCDMMQEEYDRECKPVRVYLHIGNDRCATYAGLAGATK